ncbi:hypothetical protein DL96DRAFT_639007 [Flagelloscypha sp. PMI_526]|nr:hypothetical protein DL96DRAFT_639007 [Flagelloscypha sp. PMI_526]
MGRWKLSHKQRPGGLKSPSAQLALRVLLASFRSEPTPRRRFLFKKSKCRVCKKLEQRVTAIEQLVTTTPKNYALQSLLKVDKKCQVLQRENAHLRLEVHKQGRNESLIPSSPIPARDNTLAGLPAQDPHQQSRSLLLALKHPISKHGRAKSKPEKLTIPDRNRTSTSELQRLSTQKQIVRYFDDLHSVTWLYKTAETFQEIESIGSVHAHNWSEFRMLPSIVITRRTTS